VTWQFTIDEPGKRDFYWGKYYSNKDAATRNYENRAAIYYKEYEVFDTDCYNYYSTQRPVDIGTFPKTDNGPVIIVNFDERETVAGENFKAWGYLIYDAPLSEKQMSDYELRAASDNNLSRNAERQSNNKPIAERLREGAEQAAKNNAALPIPAKITDRSR